jgi:hypothetical protein
MFFNVQKFKNSTYLVRLGAHGRKSHRLLIQALKRTNYSTLSIFNCAIRKNLV